MKKVPTIVLSVSYKGVKFIDATNKVRLSSKTEQCSYGMAAFSDTVSPLVMMKAAFLKLIFESLFISLTHFIHEYNW